jgi:DNA-nicking Smr family endonuclease
VTKKLVSPADSNLFREAVGDVNLIKNDKVILKQPVAPKPYPKPTTAQDHAEWQRFIEPELDYVSHEQTLNFTAPGIQKSVLAKLRKGYFGIQAEIDLHGLTVDAAKQQLLRVIQHSVATNRRCIHIIHGKGYRSTEQHPVLKNQINRWLREHKDVQAFCSASARQGGAGAVWVLLRAAIDEQGKYGE